jgi:hypothetical protein
LAWPGCHTMLFKSVRRSKSCLGMVWIEAGKF